MYVEGPFHRDFAVAPEILLELPIAVYSISTTVRCHNPSLGYRLRVVAPIDTLGPKRSLSRHRKRESRLEGEERRANRASVKDGRAKKGDAGRENKFIRIYALRENEAA